MLPSRSVLLVAARTTVSRRSGRRKALGWAGDHRWSQWHGAALLGLVLKHARRVAGFDEAIVLGSLLSGLHLLHDFRHRGAVLPKTDPEIMRAQQVVSGQDRYVLGEQVLHSPQELPRCARCG